MGKNENKNWSLLICIALTLAALAVFYQVYRFEFIDLDDPDYVSNNPNVQQGITLKAIKWAFTAGYASNWHPLTWLSHMLDWQLFGNNAGGHHITNLIFHIANTLLLFLVLKQMTKTLWQSAFVAALFALHPLHVESIAWVSERKDVLSTFFWILTMWAYLRYVKQPKIIAYLLVVVFFALGLMSKPMLVTLPFVLLLLDYWPLNRLGKKHSLLYLLIEKIPLFAMALAASAATFIIQKETGTMRITKDYGFLVRIANASISYLQYIIKMICPVRLSYFYLHPGQNVSFVYAAISAVLLLAITVLVLRFAKKRQYLVTGWLWYLGTLVPVIGIVQVGIQAMADRYSYIPLIGLFIIIAWGLPELLAKLPYRRAVLGTSALIVLSVLAVLAHLQTQYWKDSEILYQHALKVTDNNWKVHMDIAQALLRQKRFEEAIYHGSESVRIKPDCADAVNVLGVVLYYAGRTDQAIAQFNRALQIDPQSRDARKNLDIVLATEQKPRDENTKK